METELDFVSRSRLHEILRHEVADKEGRCEGCVLDYHNELVAQRREYRAQRLRNDDVPGALGRAHAEASRRLRLPRVHRLQARADHLGDIGGAVAYKGDGDA